MTKTQKGRRRQGRPVAADGAVGKDALLLAAQKLLQELPPSMVTISSIARAANVDPALVRYYFGNREGLLIAVVDKLLETVPKDLNAGTSTSDALEDRVKGVFRFTRSAKHIQRLMLDEFINAESPAMRERAKDANAGAVQTYEKIQERDHGRELVKFDPLFLHIAIVGMTDFFVSARPIIEALAPDEDIEKMQKKYEAFAVSLILNGLLRR